MPAFPGPTANLPGIARRSGLAGTVWMDGKMRGEIISVDWTVEVQQISVPIPGRYQNETKPGAEARSGTVRIQDVDDYWRMKMYQFLDARRRNDVTAAAAFPEFDIITQIADIGAPAVSRWALRGCQLYTYAGGFSSDDDTLVRDVPFTFRDDGPVDGFVYTDGGVASIT